MPIHHPFFDIELLILILICSDSYVGIMVCIAFPSSFLREYAGIFVLRREQNADRRAENALTMAHASHLSRGWGELTSAHPILIGGTYSHPIRRFFLLLGWSPPLPVPRRRVALLQEDRLSFSPPPPDPNPTNR